MDVFQESIYRTFIHKEVNYILDSFSLNNTKILIAASGGKDSLCLMKLIKDYQSIYNYHIGILHCDHRWRNDSQANAKLVYSAAKMWNFSFYLGINNIYLLTESVTRKWRYTLLFNIAAYYSYDIVLTAHNETDRIETFFLNLYRGSGLNGINSLFYSRIIINKLLLVRPLLTMTQSETYWFCRRFLLPIWSDSTNFYFLQKRSRLRQELFPYIKQYFHPYFDRKVVSFLEEATMYTEYTQSCVHSLYNYVVHPTYSAINIRRLMRLATLFQVRILEDLLSQIIPNIHVRYSIQQVLTYIVQKKISDHHLRIHQLVLVKKTTYLYFCVASTQI